MLTHAAQPSPPALKEREEKVQMQSAQAAHGTSAHAPDAQQDQEPLQDAGGGESAGEEQEQRRRLELKLKQEAQRSHDLRTPGALKETP